MKLALALAMVLLLGVGSVLAADEFPVSTKQPLPSGNGWRVIYADFPASTEFAWTVAVASDQAGFHDLWQRLAGPAIRSRPVVDFDRNIVVLFGHGTNSCTVRATFHGVAIDPEARLVRPQISTLRRCPFLDLSSAAVYLVAVARAHLPRSPFTVYVLDEPGCSTCPDQPDTITVDL